MLDGLSFSIDVAIGTIIGAAITAFVTWRIDRSRRAEDVRARKRESVIDFQAAAHTCLHHAATVPGAREMAKKVGKGWSLTTNFMLSRRSVKLYDGATLNGMGDFISLRIARDRIRSTWGDCDLSNLVTVATDEIQDAYTTGLEDGTNEQVSAKIKPVLGRLEAIASIVQREAM
jgi:hypothetical protein